jgi:hypothetical protein
MGEIDILKASNIDKTYKNVAKSINNSCPISVDNSCVKFMHFLLGFAILSY